MSSIFHILKKKKLLCGYELSQQKLLETFGNLNWIKLCNFWQPQLLFIAPLDMLTKHKMESNFGHIWNQGEFDKITVALRFCWNSKVWLLQNHDDSLCFCQTQCESKHIRLKGTSLYPETYKVLYVGSYI